MEAAPWDQYPALFPPDPDLEPLHGRQYQVRAWRLSEDAMLLRGAVMDLRPGPPLAARIVAAGGVDDGRPLPNHHMIVDLTVGYPSLVIQDASVVFESYPQPGCPGISPHYRELIGLSIARGFVHEVRQRFGGPRGCTHTTALLQAMVPVALQAIFAMRQAQRLTGADEQPEGAAEQGDTFMRDTCHIWSADGDMWANLQAGQPVPMSLATRRRLHEAGVDPDAVDFR
jgi:hypothetical protein